MIQSISLKSFNESCLQTEVNKTMLPNLSMCIYMYERNIRIFGRVRKTAKRDY
jgi:hypothetical protein